MSDQGSERALEPEPAWDAERAASIVGKHVLVGLTYLDANDRLIEHKQVHGTITSAHPKKGIAVLLKGNREGETFMLPPHLASLQPARPGEYHLRSTGETVVDPDLVATWTLNAPPAGGPERSG